ncbi:TonB-dependent receptor plug domain-containing protein [Bradyrhizobium viridifuturi]|uniref:TonB-dependent receptor plug domain-containing protein n=1 Tax=Bradyrhizobium viridifuturi TaxID=1654716 RepID=UPI00322167C2
MNARAQIGAVPVQSLDTITAVASKTDERAIDALAPVSSVTLEKIQGLQPNRVSDIFYNVPGVSFQERGDDPATVINIRGLQDFGRVASWSTARGRTISAPATMPTARSSSIPN